MAAVILLPLCIYSQSSIYREDYNLNLKIQSTDGLPDRIISAYHNGEIYIVNGNSAIGKKALLVSTYNTASKTTGMIKIPKTKQNAKVFDQMILSIGASTDKLFIVTSTNIHILKKEGKGWSISKSLANSPTFNRIYPLNENGMLLYVNYNFHPSDEPYKHTWAKLDLKTDSLCSEIHLDDDNSRFSYFVNDWISTYKGIVAYAKTTDYKIFLYNSQFQAFDSIIAEKFNDNQKALPHVPKGNLYSSDEMKGIASADDSLLHRIERVFLLDSSMLMVTVKRPKTKYYTFDLWSKQAGTWYLTKTQQIECEYQEGKEYNKSNNQINGFFGNHASIVYDGKKHFYIYYYPFRDNIETGSFNRQKDFIEPINGLVRKNELYYGVRKLDIIK